MTGLLGEAVPEDRREAGAPHFRGLLQGGLAPFGLRYMEQASDPLSAKGKGYFGLLGRPGGGVSTELSASDNTGNAFPLLVPTLTPDEVKHLLDGNDPTAAIYIKAVEHAKQRAAAGLSPFSQPDELRIPQGLLNF